MTQINRRQFLDASSKAGAGLAAAGVVSTAIKPAKAASANEKVILGIVGVGGRGSSLARGFVSRD